MIGAGTGALSGVSTSLVGGCAGAERPDPQGTRININAAGKIHLRLLEECCITDEAVSRRV
jgi:hypothetical protein